MDKNAGKEKPADKNIHEDVDDILHASREHSSLNHKVMDMMLHAKPSDREDFQNISVKQLDKLTRSTAIVDDQHLHNLVLDDKTPGEKKAAAMAYELAAGSSSNKGDQINKMAAAILSDERIAREIKDGQVQKEQQNGHDTIGRFSGLAASVGTYLGVKGLLSVAEQSLPLPPAAKALVAAGTAVLAGGVLDNKLSNRELSSMTGFTEAAVGSAGIAAGSWLMASRLEGSLLRGHVASIPFEISHKAASTALLTGVLSGFAINDGYEGVKKARQMELNFDEASKRAAGFIQAKADAGTNSADFSYLTKLSDHLKPREPEVFVPEWLDRLDKRFQELNPNR